MRLDRLEMAFEGKALRDGDVSAGMLMVKSAGRRLLAWPCRPRHATHSGLPPPSIDPAHDQIHAIERGAVQGLLEVGGFAAGREANLKVRRRT
jgi:hypothetical protein